MPMGHRSRKASRPRTGPEDLAVMGVNLMDPRRRRAVLETSLETSAAALGGHRGRQSRVA